MTRLWAVAAVAAAGILFSTGGAAVKLTEWGAWQVASSRSLVAAAVLFLVLPAARREFRSACLLVGLAYGLTLVLFVHANKLTTAAATTFLQATSPLYVALLGPLLLHERMRRSDKLLLPAFALGLLLLLLSTAAGDGTRVSTNPALGSLLAALSGLSYALTVMGIRSLQSGPGDGAGASAVALGNVFAAAMCLPWLFPLEPGGPLDLGVVVFLGAFQIAGAYVLLLRAARELTALEVALILMLEPVLSPVWAFWLHGERPPALVFAGGALIVAATALKAWWESRVADRAAT